MIDRLNRFSVVFFVAISLVVCVQLNLAHAQQSQPGLPSPIRFHHATLSVRDVDRVSQWYVKVLGFKQTNRFTLTRPDGQKIQVVRVEVPGLQMNVSQFPSSVSLNREGERQGWRHLALQVNSVDQTYQRLQQQGVQFLTKPFTYNPPGYRIAFFQDIEGNILELYQDL
jgi:catechol 2,3-dioxygenase-like lactoylglutathione lyase family enzyme